MGQHHVDDSLNLRLPTTPVQRWLRPLARFLRISSASGVVLLGCTVLALFLANSAWREPFRKVLHWEFGFQIGDFRLVKTLEWWINDGLMTIFFFVVGLEIKREIVVGELRDPRKAALPVMAALGGMIAPAGIYLVQQGGQPGEPGWGIPMATDIAFVVGFLALLGPRVPFGLKIMLLSLAIADDLGAVLVIALFYTQGLNTTALALAGAGFVLIVILNLIGVRRISVYVIAGAFIWLLVYQSGVHPTVAGVLLGLLTPTWALVDRKTVRDLILSAARRFQGDGEELEEKQRAALEPLSRGAIEAVPPLERLEQGLHPWVAFGIMPLFALANAGVPIQVAELAHPVALAVALGLVLGKPLGIVGFSWLAVRLNLARLPSGVNWPVMVGAGCLAGIGFTMSLFIAGLAFQPPLNHLLDPAKIGTLSGSLVSAVLGSVLLIVFLPRNKPDHSG